MSRPLVRVVDGWRGPELTCFCDTHEGVQDGKIYKGKDEDGGEARASASDHCVERNRTSETEIHCYHGG